METHAPFNLAFGAKKMSGESLRKSWKRTEGFLREARAQISEAGEAICADNVLQFEEFLEHNELELALDKLDDIFEESEFESWRMLELMALAAASMGLIERQQRYDAELSEARLALRNGLEDMTPNKRINFARIARPTRKVRCTLLAGYARRWAGAIQET